MFNKRLIDESKSGQLLRQALVEQKCGNELISMFDERSRELLQKLKAGLTNKDFDLAHKCAHSLKGISLTIGAQAMGKISSIMESETAKQSVVMCEKLAGKLEVARKKTLKELKEALLEKS